jgi:hypothetical protein
MGKTSSERFYRDRGWSCDELLEAIGCDAPQPTGPQPCCQCGVVRPVGLMEPHGDGWGCRDCFEWVEEGTDASDTSS